MDSKQGPKSQCRFKPEGKAAEPRKNFRFPLNHSATLLESREFFRISDFFGCFIFWVGFFVVCLFVFLAGSEGIASVNGKAPKPKD